MPTARPRPGLDWWYAVAVQDIWAKLGHELSPSTATALREIDEATAQMDSWTLVVLMQGALDRLVRRGHFDIESATSIATLLAFGGSKEINAERRRKIGGE